MVSVRGRGFGDCVTKWDESAAHSILARTHLAPPEAVYISADQTRLLFFACYRAADHTFLVLDLLNNSSSALLAAIWNLRVARRVFDGGTLEQPKIEGYPLSFGGRRQRCQGRMKNPTIAG